MNIVLLFLFGWVLCGGLAYGVTLGYFHSRFPESDNTPIAYAVSIAGPIGLAVAFVMSDFAKYGLRYTR